MAYYLLLLFHLSFATIISAVNIERILYVKVDDPYDVCCEINQEDTEVLALFSGSTKLRSLKKGNPNLQIDADSDKFIKRFPQFEMQNLNDKVSTLCIHKKSGATYDEDNNITFVCKINGDFGLGKTINEEEITLRIYELLKMEPMPDVVSVDENGIAVLSCKARGQPGLTMRWTDAEGKSLVDNSTANVEEESETRGSETTLKLKLSLVNRSNDNMNITCEAKTSYPEDQKPLFQSTTLSVTYPPELLISRSTIHTDLESIENIEIIIRGNPIPQVSCEQLDVSEPKQIMSFLNESSNSLMTHSLGPITEKDIGYYKCVAVNRLGRSEENLQITIHPSLPTVYPETSSKYSDYYLLGWNTYSRAPPINVSIYIQEKLPLSELNLEDDLRSILPVRRLLVDLRDVDNLRTIFHEVTNNRTWEHSYWHHLSNLSENTEYKIALRVCNKHACSGFDFGSDVENQSLFTFKTASYDGYNKVDPEILQRRPEVVTSATNDSTGQLVIDGISNTTALQPAFLLMLLFVLPIIRLYVSGLL